MAFEHAGRLVGLKGTLLVDAGLRFVVEDGVQIRRRRSTRVDMRLPIALRIANGAQTYDGTTVNVSADGALIEVDAEVPVGARVQVSFELSDSELSGQATVVRHGNGLLAVQFKQESSLLRSAMRDLVATQRLTGLHPSRHR